MNDLLQVAVNAHGGLERWNQLKTVKASVSITGGIWQVKGEPDSSCQHHLARVFRRNIAWEITVRHISARKRNPIF
jgi:hypothetical protein